MQDPFELEPPPPFPLRSIAVLLLCAGWLLLGTIGHAPWKPDDILHLTAVWGWHQNTSTWPHLVIPPQLWVEDLPAWHTVAWFTAWLLGWLLPFHDAARLASALFGALLLGCIWRAAARWYGSNPGRIAPILALGTLGLLLPIHEASPALAALACTSLAYYGVSRLPTTPLLGALALGGGIASTFMLGGARAFIPALPLLLIPLHMRVCSVRWALCGAAMLAALLIAMWLIILFKMAPAFFDLWLTQSRNDLAQALRWPSLDHLQLLAWASWPVSLLAGWSWWLSRRQWRQSSILVPTCGFVCALLWFLANPARMDTALPLIPPLILLATASVHRLRRGAGQALDWFSIMTFSMLAGLVWLGASALWLGWPEKIAENFNKLAPGFDGQLSPLALFVALLLTGAWVGLLFYLPRSPWRPVARWSGGLVVFWGLLAMLLMPIIDHAKSFRAPMRLLRSALPQNPGCIAGRDLSLTLRAALDYHTNLDIQAEKNTRCRWLLTQTRSAGAALPGWSKVWSGQRPGDKIDKLTLYRRSF
jgi:hypothetical protein